MKTIKYIKRVTKGMTPAERFMWLERYIYLPLKKESIDYVNGKPVPVSSEIDLVAETQLEKDDDPTGGLID